jgi:16S rRNA (cytidine1402-2'-O)-methyltransferase
VVATPIGNLGDITERARQVLDACDGVIAEDTRHSGNLLKHLGIHKPLYSLPAFDEAARVEPLVRRLVEGQSLALVTDAGTPAISDPGAILVRRALEEGVQVVPVPGASAAVAAVSVSGFPEGRFHFAGFLPRKASHREEMLTELRGLRAQLVFYESPQRLARTLAELRSRLGDRPALVARELTKLHEELARGTLSELERRFSGDVRGEIVIVVRGAPEPSPDDPLALEEEVRARLARGEHPKDIADALSPTHSKRDIYQLALKLKKSVNAADQTPSTPARRGLFGVSTENPKTSACSACSAFDLELKSSLTGCRRAPRRARDRRGGGAPPGRGGSRSWGSGREPVLRCLPR